MTILGILKIIGIVILVILGILLLLLLLVLFVPLRYRADAVLPDNEDSSRTNGRVSGEKPGEPDQAETGNDTAGEARTGEGGTDDKKSFPPPGTKAEVRFSWLLHLINGAFLYPERQELFVRVACFTIIPKGKKDKKPGGDTAADTDKEKEENEAPAEEAGTGEEESEASAEEAATTGKENEAPEEEAVVQENGAPEEEAVVQENEAPAEEAVTQENGESAESDEQAADTAEDEDISGTDREETDGEKVKKKKKKDQNTGDEGQEIGSEKTGYTISSVCDKIEMVCSTVENPIFQRALDVVMRGVKRILRHLLPVRTKGRIRAGMGDPAATADIAAVYGIMYPAIGPGLKLVPDFDRKTVSGDIHVKGRIRLIVIVWTVVCTLLNRDVRKTIRRVKQLVRE